MGCEYLAIDPGETTGWASFNANGDIITFDSVKGRNGVYELLAAQAPRKIIMEDYSLYPWKATEQSWSKLITVRIIGAVEYYCALQDIELVLQEPRIKGIAYKWAGMVKPKRKQDTHAADAYVHGVYYLQLNGIRKPQQGRRDV